MCSINLDPDETQSKSVSHLDLNSLTGRLYCNNAEETVNFRMRLFDDTTDSPATSQTWNEIKAVLTPSADKTADSGFGSGADLSIELPVRKRLPKKVSSDVKRSLFCSKRQADQDEADDSPMAKKMREAETGLKSCSVQDSTVIDAVDRLTTEQDLVADGSRDYCLPTIPGKHSDLKSISCDAMADVLSGKFGDQLAEVTTVDCRYPYEFEGGHIKGAVNMYTKDAVQSLLQIPVTSEKKHVLIFHCEFSSERGPKMYRFLRSQDREMNKDNYPALNFPEVYLLDGGYKAFYGKYSELCDPISYKPMLHEEHEDDLRHFRVKSKSWAAGDKQKTSRRCRSRLSRQSLEF